MGVHVHLAIFTARVDDATWRAVFADARRVVSRWAPRALSSGWRRIGSERVAQYTDEVEGPEGLYIVGDAESLCTAESFVFPATLCAYRPASHASAEVDILTTVARDNQSTQSHDLEWRDLFGSKTQGLPYHGLIVALGALVEHRLPGTAVVYGDVSRKDAELARSRLTELLNEHVALPVVADRDRLRRRLAVALEGDELDAALRHLEPSDPHTDALMADLLLAHRAGSPNARVRHELERLARACEEPQRLHVGTRQLLHRVGAAVHDAARRMELRAHIERIGEPHARETIARSSSSAGVRLTRHAWDRIEAAGVDELAFVLAALRLESPGWALHHAVCALLENPRLRTAAAGSVGTSAAS